MKRNSQSKKSNLPADIWLEFVQSELKNKSKIGTLLESAEYGGYENKSLTIYFSDDAVRKKAQGKREVIQKKLTDNFRLLCDRIDFKTGSAPANIVATSTTNTVEINNIGKLGNPLQTLYCEEANLPEEKDDAQKLKILKKTVAADKTCSDIYQKLRDRTLKLVDNKEENILKVTFNWRLRVGGTRGFRELLLPVMHPIFGIPYIPASTLKGAAKAWAKRHGASEQVYEILGMLEGKKVKAAKVEFLDAFPTKPCLNIDIATPQWTWVGNEVKYQPVPHSFLSLHQPEFLIGLRLSAVGKGNPELIPIVKKWLENALAEGIGSRVSSGYGRTLNTFSNFKSIYKSANYEFELWTEGIYGYDASSKTNAEFRPTAVRGILRYWFRAVALSLYNAETCQELEKELFGDLGKQGKIYIYTKANPSPSQEPLYYGGKIYLQATEDKYLEIAKKLLLLASCIGGVGRGSRRPLHRLDRINIMRGCHWEVTDHNLPLDYDKNQWQEFFNQLNNVFHKIKKSTKKESSPPRNSQDGKRQQDVLDKNTQIWLVKSPEQIHPKRVKDWNTQGKYIEVRGEALTFLYSSHRFKGGSNGRGNPKVGGALGIPSFVWIKSIFPDKNEPYQVVTIFGCNNSDRLDYAKELDKLSKRNQAILIFGDMPDNNHQSVTKPRRR